MVWHWYCVEKWQMLTKKEKINLKEGIREELGLQSFQMS